MTTLYEITIFLAIGLIAIIVTVFVIAASLLGRAIEESSRKQEEIVKRESSEFDETIAGLQEKLKGAKKADVIDDLKNQISDYEAKKKEAEKESKRISKRYGFLTVKGTVLYPGIFFLVSIVLAGVARYIVTLPPVTGSDGTEVFLILIPGLIEDPVLLFVANVVWVLSLLALAWGCYRICQCLRVIEGVAITTEEAQFKRMTQALETALERHEESKRPKLELKFRKIKPPFNYKPNVKETIACGIVLNQGDEAKAAELWFFAPKEFEFPGSHTWYQESESPMPNTLTTSIDLGDLKRGTTYWHELGIKTPSKIGKYSLGYQLKCVGFASEVIKFEVKVE
jgi:ABC-type multidrug transport system fused ATPase/permease subunit